MAEALIAPPPGFELDEEFPSPPEGFELDSVTPLERSPERQAEWERLEQEKRDLRARAVAGEDWAKALEVGEQLTGGFARIPSTLYNQPARVINLAAGQPVIKETATGESVLPEFLKPPDELTKDIAPLTQSKLGKLIFRPEAAEQIAGGLKGVEDLVRGTATPEVLMTLPAGGIGGALSRAPGAAFAGQMIQHTPEAYSEFGRLSVEGTPGEAVRAGVGAVGSSLAIGHLATAPMRAIPKPPKGFELDEAKTAEAPKAEAPLTEAKAPEVVEPLPEVQPKAPDIKAEEIASKPAGSTGPEVINAMPDAEFNKLIEGTGERKYSLTVDATAWAMQQKATPELIASLTALRDAESAKTIAAYKEKQFDRRDRSQWYSDALHVLKKDEVGLGNVERVSQLAKDGTIKIASGKNASEAPATAAGKVGEQSALPAATPVEAKPPKPPTPNQELNTIILQHGMELDWTRDLDSLHGPWITETSNLGSGGLAAKRLQSADLKKARERAAADLGISRSKLDTPEGRAELLAKLKERIAAKPKGGELDIDVPLTLRGEKATFVEPAKETTVFGGEKLSQTDLFEIEQVTKEVDPFKSADAAERMYGDEAVAKIENQLRVMDSDPQVRKSFTKEQRGRLSEVLNLLRERETTKGDQFSEGAGEVSDWTSATEEVPAKTTESGVQEYAGAQPMELQAGIPIPKFANRKMSPLDRVTTSHSGKLQKSMDEARRAQREIKKEVPSERRQAAISIWREANGDLPTLQTWAAAAKGKAFKQAALDAQTLTPKEIAIAKKAIAAFDVLEKRGNTFDVLKSHRDNYIPHVWDVKRPGTGFGTGMLKQRFRFSKARTFNTFFEGDQAGFKPKTLAIGKLLPAYIHEMNTVISDRQMVRDIAAGKMPDGSPMATPRGNVKVVDGPQGKAVLTQPRASREPDTSDYRVMADQPALSGWTWEGKDTDGKPVFVKADLALHPDAYRRINATLGQSALRTWYRDPVTGMAQIPRAVLRGLDTAQGVMKREMFGLLAPFHQVQEGTHAVGHLVNPFFGIPKIDLRNPAQFDAANHGLMLLPDRASARVYLEGVGTKTSLVSRGIRKVGKPGEAIADVIDGYQDYLFHQYIPGLKFKTYEAMLNRNTKLYAEELKAGTMTDADVKITSAEQANAAYGHLNYALLDRNPTIQHLIQMAALAPDFLEARVRFAGQGVKGLSSKVGHEQFKAIAILAAAQAGAAVILSSMLGVPYDPKHPFEVIYKGRRYAMRSVPEDIYGLLKDTRQFAYARVNPLTVKGGIQLATGLNYRGEKVGPLDTMEELLAGYIPITARSIPGIRSLTETGRNNPVSPLQQLAGSLGLRISSYSPVSETYKNAGEWMDAKKLARNTGSYPVSKYQQLRYALEDGDMERAAAAYAELKKTMTPAKIVSGFRESISHPFTKSRAMDAQFAASLKGYDKELYQQALRTRANMLNAFYQMPKD